MPDVPFPFLADVDRSVRQKVNSPRSKPGQPTWDDEEYEQAYNKAYAWCCRELQNMDQQYQATWADAVASAGARFVTLPTRTSYIRSVWRLDRPVADGTGKCVEMIPRIRAEYANSDQGWHQIAGMLHPGSNVINFAAPLKRTTGFRFFHGVYYIPLIHAPVLSGGGATAQLPDYEPLETNTFNGLPIIVSEGTAAGQIGSVSSYNGVTKTITVLPAWSPAVPDDTSWISSAPDLPWLAKDLFENYAVACLYEKTNEEAHRRFMGLALASREPFMSAVKLQERRAPDETYDQNLNGGWADPASMYNSP